MSAINANTSAHIMIMNNRPPPVITINANSSIGLMITPFWPYLMCVEFGLVLVATKLIG